MFAYHELMVGFQGSCCSYSSYILQAFQLEQEITGEGISEVVQMSLIFLWEEALMRKQ